MGGDRKALLVVSAVLVALALVPSSGVRARPVPVESDAHEEEERELGLGTVSSVAARASCSGRGLRALPPCRRTVVAAGTTSRRFAFDKVLIDTGGDTESSVTVGPKGTLLACSHGGFDRASPVWASSDGGRTWRDADPAPNPIVSGDCDITIMSDGTWAVVFDTIASATVATSHDRGKTWTVVYTAAVPAGSVDRPWLVANGTTLVLAYSNAPGAAQPAVQIVAISTDGGRTWLDQKIVNTSDPPLRPHAVLGRPVVHGKRIMLPTVMFDFVFGGPSWLYVVSSSDGGDTWSRKLVRGPYQTFFQFPSMSRAPDGTLYVAMPIGVRDNFRIAVLVSRNDGRSWKEIRVADHVAFAGPVSSVWVDARPDGTATLAWMAKTNEAPLDLVGAVLGVPPEADRRVWAARVGPEGVRVAAQPISAPARQQTGYEFLIVDHDAKGRAHIVAPLRTGPSCQRPSAVGRGGECIYDFIER
jgi:hypothetical protein